jgi:hypothetical protein
VPRDPDARARKLYAERWADYVRFKVDTSATAPVAFVIDARTQEGAQQIAAELADAKFDISRKWWPFGRRWRLMAASRPIPLARASVDAWFEGLLRLLHRDDAEFVHWVPLGPQQPGTSVTD